jgi:transcriptional regulator with XRE-family HTH domain
METNETGDQLAAFGRWLVRERELRGLRRDEVARATKLAPGVVEALESGEQARIPPHAYVVGYLRAYAQAVGLGAAVARIGRGVVSRRVVSCTTRYMRPKEFGCSSLCFST